MLTAAILFALLFGAFALLAVAILQECTRWLALVWKAVRQFSLRTVFVFTALASVGSLMIRTYGLEASLAAILAVFGAVFWLALVLAAIVLAGLLLHELLIALECIPQLPARQRLVAHLRGQLLRRSASKRLGRSGRQMPARVHENALQQDPPSSAGTPVRSS